MQVATRMGSRHGSMKGLGKLAGISGHGHETERDDKRQGQAFMSGRYEFEYLIQVIIKVAEGMIATRQEFAMNVRVVAHHFFPVQNLVPFGDHREISCKDCNIRDLQGPQLLNVLGLKHKGLLWIMPLRLRSQLIHQSSTLAITSCMACWSEGGKAGQCQMTSDIRDCTARAMVCAFFDAGDDLNPWR